MLKSITSGKVSHHIPNDLTFSILSKLPLKSFKRFTSACKSWSLFFQDPIFFNTYGNIFMSSNSSSYQEGSSFLLQQTQKHFPVLQDLYLLSGERFENKIKLDRPHPFQELNNQAIYILGPVINGIVCLYQGRKPRVVLWNPATQESNLLPSSPPESSVYHVDGYFKYHGFGYDHVTDDYKVIRYVSFIVSLTDFDQEDGGMIGNVEIPDAMWEVYSLRKNSWKKLDLDMPRSSHGYAGVFVYMKGVCHWYTITEGGYGEDEYENKTCLVSFDLSNEVFSTTSMPSEMKDGSGFVYVNRHLTVLNDHIAFIWNYIGTTTFHISILGELGVKESWTKIFIFGPLPRIEEPIGVGENGDLFFRRKDDELVWFNLSTRMIKRLGIKGKIHFCQMVVYKESLVRIGQISD